MEEKELLEKIKENVIQGRKEKDDEGFGEGFEGQPAVKELVIKAVEKVEPKVIVEVLAEAMKVVGQKFEKKEYFIPEMLASADAVLTAMNILAPYLEKAGVKTKGKVILATVKGDLHDIGKNIVGMVLKGTGFEVKDLGIDISEEILMEAVRKERPQIIGLSALLTTTMINMKLVIEKLREQGLRDSVRVILGGAPLSEKYAQAIGADGYAPDAFSAQKLVEKLLQPHSGEKVEIRKR